MADAREQARLIIAQAINPFAFEAPRQDAMPAEKNAQMDAQFAAAMRALNALEALEKAGLRIVGATGSGPVGPEADA